MLPGELTWFVIELTRLPGSQRWLSTCFACGYQTINCHFNFYKCGLACTKYFIKQTLMGKFASVHWTAGPWLALFARTHKLSHVYTNICSSADINNKWNGVVISVCACSRAHTNTRIHTNTHAHVSINRRARTPHICALHVSKYRNYLHGHFACTLYSHSHIDLYSIFQSISLILLALVLFAYTRLYKHSRTYVFVS